jgi:hypothetical protein
MTSDNPRGVHRSQSDEPDNQQERPARESTSESSETIRRTSGVLDEEMVRAAWRHVGTTPCVHLIRRIREPISEIPCRVSHELAPERSDLFLIHRLISAKPSGACGSARVMPREVLVTP